MLTNAFLFLIAINLAFVASYLQDIRDIVRSKSVPKGGIDHE